MEKAGERTKGKWSFKYFNLSPGSPLGSNYAIVDEQGAGIAELITAVVYKGERCEVRTKAEAEANAAYIVKCVNAHEGLVKSVKELLAIQNRIEVCGEWESLDINKGLLATERRIIEVVNAKSNAALALAEGK